MALKEANGLSYTYNGKLVDNLTIVEDKIRAELKANVRDKPTLFYPCWIVDLPLNDVYPGFIYYIEVLLWADSGEVISCKEMGYGGSIPDGSSNSTLPSLTPTPTPSATPNIIIERFPNYPLLTQTAIILAIAILAVAVFLLLHRRHRKTASLSK